MKTSLTLVALLSLSCLSLQAKPIPGGDKITRAEAQHLALQQIPDGSVKSVSQEKVDGHSVWTIKIAKRGSEEMTEVRVDGLSGHIVPSSNAASPAEGPKH